MGKCDKIEDTCGKKINSRCVDYEGEVNSQSELEQEGCLNLHETTEDIYDQLEDIQTSIDLSDFKEDCIEYEQEGETLKVNEVLKGLQDKVCELAETEEGCHPIFDADITCLGLDLDCLSTDPCGDPITTFKQLIQAMITQACS